MELSFIPTFDRMEIQRRLDGLLLPSAISDAAVEGRIAGLAAAFQSYASAYPLPLWAPGLVITNEMRALTEALFPVAKPSALFRLVLRRGCRISPMLAGTYLHATSNWLDLLQKLTPHVRQADPAVTLRELAQDGEKRRNFLFALMLPPHFGGGFDRYPTQSSWLLDWLRENRERLKGRLRALDSACGSGEGTYGLAELAEAAGFSAVKTAVHGSTIEPVELFAAAHAFFPHDPEREKAYRARVAPLLDRGMDLEFYLEDVKAKSGRESYDVVLCNGLLGGPLLHERDELCRAIGELASRVSPGGILLAADRFHAGWRQRIPSTMLLDMLREHGLTPLEVPEGLAAAR